MQGCVPKSANARIEISGGLSQGRRKCHAPAGPPFQNLIASKPAAYANERSARRVVTGPFELNAVDVDAQGDSRRSPRSRRHGACRSGRPNSWCSRAAGVIAQRACAAELCAPERRRGRQEMRRRRKSRRSGKQSRAFRDGGERRRSAADQIVTRKIGCSET